MNFVSAFLVALSIALVTPALSRAEGETPPGEVYGRLVAPCCWNQTLDIHDSELATRLRVEIAERLKAGESSLAIEDDMAARYGERIRAVPRARDPRQSMALLVVAAMAGVLFALFALARRWTRRRTTNSDDSVLADEPRTEYDARLDHELARVDSAR